MSGRGRDFRSFGKFSSPDLKSQKTIYPNLTGIRYANNWTNSQESALLAAYANSKKIHLKTLEQNKLLQRPK